MAQTVIEKHITVMENGCCLIDILAASTPLSRQKLKDALTKGCVWQTLGNKTRRVRRAKKSIPQGSEIHLYYNEKILAKKIQSAQLISDEGDFSVWDKPSGMLSQGSKWGDHSSLPRWAEQNLKPQRNSFIVHRLDRAASGIIMLAHSKFAAAKLSQLFAKRRIFKRYQARVVGHWKHKAKRTVTEPIDDKPAISHIQLVAQDERSSLVEVIIETGYKHQIRRHLSGLGFPIIGDRLYGSVLTDLPQQENVDLQLRAVEMRFNHPISSKPVHFLVNGQFDDLYQ